MPNDTNLREITPGTLVSAQDVSNLQALTARAEVAHRCLGFCTDAEQQLSALRLISAPANAIEAARALLLEVQAFQKEADFELQQAYRTFRRDLRYRREGEVPRCAHCGQEPSVSGASVQCLTDECALGGQVFDRMQWGRRDDQM